MNDMFPGLKLLALALPLCLACDGRLEAGQTHPDSAAYKSAPFLAAAGVDDPAPATAPTPATPPTPDTPSSPETNSAPEPPGAYQVHRVAGPVVFNDLIVEKGETNFGDALVVKGSSTID